MRQNPLLYAAYIIEAIGLIEEFIDGMNKEQFLQDKKTYHAVLYSLQTMAEATQNLGLEIQGNYPQIGWRQIRGFRNVLAHEYLGDIDDNIVWNAINNNLQMLKSAMLEVAPNWKELRLVAKEGKK